MANAGYSQPGAIPVATPVPAEETVYLQHSTVVATNAPPAAPSSPSQQRQNFGATDPTLARVPMMMRQCPRCRQESRTRVTTKPSWQTWLATGALCFVFWPIFWVPLVVDNCKETSHYWYDFPNTQTCLCHGENRTII
mmetsp:Transcript_17384/g.32113  ORF Transcript_17384/g.32113 Transcript_17384/m.32113 type:complete len:138 (+) Transcript_17384:372-785(+)